MFFTYILYSQSKDKYYIGHTYHLDERLIEHNAGKTPSTKSGKPWIIVHQESYETKSGAAKREIEIKNKKNRKYIEFLISSS